MNVFFNGRPRWVEKRTLSYDEIAVLTSTAGPVVSYQTREGVGGALEPGDVIAVSEGLRLDAVEA